MELEYLECVHCDDDNFLLHSDFLFVHTNFYKKISKTKLQQLRNGKEATIKDCNKYPMRFILKMEKPVIQIVGFNYEKELDTHMLNYSNIRIDDDYRNDVTIKKIKKGVRAYSQNKYLFDVEDKEYTWEEFLTLVEKGSVKARGKNVGRVHKIHPILGVIYEEMFKKYPLTYVKYNENEFCGKCMLTVKFHHTKIYVGIKNTEIIIKFNRPTDSLNYILVDIAKPNVDPAKEVMKFLKSCATTDSMVTIEDNGAE